MLENVEVTYAGDMLVVGDRFLYVGNIERWLLELITDVRLYMFVKC